MKKYSLTILGLIIFWGILSGMESVYENPGDQTTILLPTAYTMPKGKFSLTNYQVFFIQLTYAATNSTHLSIGSIVPFFEEFSRTLSFGFKQRYLSKGQFNSAVFAFVNPDSEILALGNMLSVGAPTACISLGVGFAKDGREDFESPAFTLSARKNLSKKVAFMMEVGTTLEEMEDNADGMLTFGFRFIGDSISWELGGVRPLGKDMDYIYFIPILKATFEF
ncbi:MAG: hypothetical protein PHI68_02535 [Candidatus Cloacimonetes bacterium]|nr:hypothetical protein [Candidatus Cloacimonadota bacterium]